MQRKIIKIAIDGFSSCGKSTLAKDLARTIGYTYIDSGAMYRAVTYYAITNNLIKGEKVEHEILIEHLNAIEITFEHDSENNPMTYLNGINIESEIRSIEVSSKVSIISAITEVRKKMVDLQRNMSNEKSVVMDGRDIGTVVFPDADLKFFLTADVKIRAQRRFDEIKVQNPNIDFELIIRNIQERDFLDQNRDDSPLAKAENAILIDNSNLSKQEQLQLVLEHLNTISNEC